VVREDMLKMTRGNGPVRLLYSKFKNSNDNMLARVDGIAPVRWFSASKW
jgi:hypothetical protein